MEYREDKLLPLGSIVEIAEIIFIGYENEENDIVMRDINVWRNEKKKI